MGQGQTTGVHPVFFNVFSQVSWVGAVLECGCLVTRVLNSAGLFGQAARSLLSVVRSLLPSEVKSLLLSEDTLEVGDPGSEMISHCLELVFQDCMLR